MSGKWMEQEIRSQPDLLAYRSETYANALSPIFGGCEFEMVVLAARGSSDHAALYARYLIEISLGIPAMLVAPSVLTRYGVSVRYPRCLCIGISQSGAAPDVAEVLEAVGGQGHETLAITNERESRVARAAKHVLHLDVGTETSIAATKTYTASVLALHQLVGALSGSTATPGPDAFHRTLSRAMVRAEEAAEAALGPILRFSPLFVLGRGYSFPTAHETALKLMECALLTAKAYSTADFQHGPRAIAGHGSAAVVYGEALEGLADQGCEITSVPESELPPELSPITDAFFGQWLALLAARARGIDPDDAPHIEKVTETL